MVDIFGHINDTIDSMFIYAAKADNGVIRFIRYVFAVSVSTLILLTACVIVPAIVVAIVEQAITAYGLVGGLGVIFVCVVVTTALILTITDPRAVGGNHV